MMVGSAICRLFLGATTRKGIGEECGMLGKKRKHSGVLGSVTNAVIACSRGDYPLEVAATTRGQ
jgi:hypothetical protein